MDWTYQPTYNEPDMPCHFRNTQMKYNTEKYWSHFEIGDIPLSIMYSLHSPHIEINYWDWDIKFYEEALHFIYSNCVTPVSPTYELFRYRK